MPAGFNLRGTIYRMESVGDDEVGGAQVTGTVYRENVYARFSGNMPEQVILQQGRETEQTFNMIVYPGTLTIKERDEFEITSPYNSPFAGERFRIMGVNYQGIHPSDKRSYILLSLTKNREAHGS